MFSVNQMNAQIKMTELWKATNDPVHPFGFSQKVQNMKSKTGNQIFSFRIYPRKWEN